jgi:murein L,D-transpeptidase YcbB/YkuD
MRARADVLGSLLEASTAETQVRSQAHVAGQLAAERKKRAGQPTPGDFNAKHPRGGRGTSQGGKFIKAGSSGTPVSEVQKRLGVQQTGHFAFDTVAAVKNLQRKKGLKVDGIVGAQTAQALLGNSNAKAVAPGALSSADAKALGVSSRSARKPAKAKAPVAARKTKRVAGGVWV